MFLPNIVLLDINCLPDEILEEMFQFVWDSDGDAAFAVLSLVVGGGKSSSRTKFSEEGCISGGLPQYMTGVQR